MEKEKEHLDCLEDLHEQGTRELWQSLSFVGFDHTVRGRCYNKHTGIRILWNRLATMKDNSRSLCTSKRSRVCLCGKFGMTRTKYCPVVPTQLVQIYFPCVCRTVDSWLSVKKGCGHPQDLICPQEDQQVGDTFQTIHNICQQEEGIVCPVVKDTSTVTTTNSSLTPSVSRVSGGISMSSFLEGNK